MLTRRGRRWGDVEGDLAPFGFTDRDWWDPFTLTPTTFDPSKTMMSTMGNMSVDLSEDDKGYTLLADLPGFDRDAIDISVDDDSVTISAERKNEHEETGSNFHRRERSYGKVRRSVKMPKDANMDGVQANYVEGVLRMTVPKMEERKQRRIPVA